MATDAGVRTGYARADGLLPGVIASAVGYAADGEPPRIHRGLPSPYATFIVSLDGPVVGGYTVEQATGPSALRADVLAAGLHDGPSFVVQPRRQSGIQLAIYPPAVRRLLAAPLAELSGQSWDAADLLGRSAAELWERVAAASDGQARFAVLHDFLRRRLDATERRRQLRPEVREAWSWLVRHRGTGAISALAEHVHLSRRQLQTVFADEFGVGPKTFNRLVRYHRTVRMISDRISSRSHAGGDHAGGDHPSDDHPGVDHAGVDHAGVDHAGVDHAGGDHRRVPVVDLAEIAQHCGYADQSHLNREFRSFTGTSPTGWINEEFDNILAGGHRNGDHRDGDHRVDD